MTAVKFCPFDCAVFEPLTIDYKHILPIDSIIHERMHSEVTSPQNVRSKFTDLFG